MVSCAQLWVFCTTYSAVATGGCDVHGTGGRREERWLARLLGGDTAPPSIRGVRLVLNILRNSSKRLLAFTVQNKQL